MTFSIETDKYDLFEIVNGKKEVIAKNCNIFELYEAINQEKHGYSYDKNNYVIGRRLRFYEDVTNKFESELKEQDY